MRLQYDGQRLVQARRRRKQNQIAHLSRELDEAKLQQEMLLKSTVNGKEV